MHAIKNHFPFEFWNVIFFLMTNCSYQYTSCITEDSKEINQCFLKHLHTAIVLLHKSLFFQALGAIFVAVFIVTHKSCSTYNCWCTYNSCLNLSNAE